MVEANENGFFYTHSLTSTATRVFVIRIQFSTATYPCLVHPPTPQQQQKNQTLLFILQPLSIEQESIQNSHENRCFVDTQYRCASPWPKETLGPFITVRSSIDSTQM